MNDYNPFNYAEFKRKEPTRIPSAVRVALEGIVSSSNSREYDSLIDLGMGKDPTD